MKIDNSKNQKIDLTSIILWIFMFVISVIFIYLRHISSYIEKFSQYSKSINELKIVNKEFDNFLLQKSAFLNYDKINNTIFIFESEIEFLDSKEAINMFPMVYQTYLKDVVANLRVKISSIEYYKSENSQLFYSLNYLFDLNKIILKSTEISIQNRNMINETLLNIIKYYTNGNISISIIEENLEYLNKHSMDKEYIEIFVQHAKMDLKRISRFSDIANLQENDKTDKALTNLDVFLNDDYQANLLIEKVMITTLFVIAIIMLYILIMMNKRSLRMRDELLSFKTAIENSYNSIIITDIDSNITYVNDVAVQDTGYTREELIGQNPNLLKSGLNEDIFYKEMRLALENGEKWEGEFINKKKDGTIFYEKASIMPLMQDNELINYIAIKSNITDYVQEKDKVEYMAFHDSLTSLPNRLKLERYVKNRFAIAKRKKTKIALLFIDLDRFKIINDTLGHDVGDELLVECAKRMKFTLRESDFIARIGGDEFAIVLESIDSNYTAGHVCKQILKTFSMPIETKNHTLNITLSIGVSMYPNDAIEYNKLLKYADIAMYEAKDSGKNTYRYYQKELSVDVHYHLDMEQALKFSIEKNEIYMVYQPKYDLIDRSVVGLEALVRWNSDSLGLVPTDKFIPIAEDTGFIIKLGLYIFKLSCIDFMEFKKSSQTLKSISINISTVQLHQDNFLNDILKIIKEVGIEHHEITLEITETHIMRNVHQSIRLFDRLKEYGFKISIDDFGTGHSSLSYLKFFPIDELKIDKSFVDDLPDDKSDVSITKAIITLSKSMDYINVAEGIENEAQENFLREKGCQIGQGYYFCKPKTKDDLIAFLN